jgi:hypothetical protein
VFVANTDTERGIQNFNIPRIPNLDGNEPLEYDFSTTDSIPDRDRRLTFQGKGYKVMKLAAGEGRVYRVVHRT